MKSGMVGRARRTAAVGVVGVFAVAGIGCTAGGDDSDDALSTDDGGAAAAAIAAAVEDARTGSGRFQTEVSTTSDYGEGPETSGWTVTGAFSGDARATTWASSDVDEGDPVAAHRAATLTLDGRTYVSVDTLREFLSWMEEPDPALEDGSADPSGEGDGGLLLGEPDPMEAWNVGVLDGKEWIDSTDLDVENGGVDGMVMSSVSLGLENDPFALLDVVTDVVEVDATEVDGVPARHFTGAVSDEALMTVLFGDEFETAYVDDDVDSGSSDEDDEWDARQAAVDAYVDEHTVITADLLLDDEGRLLRIGVEARSEVEPQYADCWAISSMFQEMTMTTDFSDMGGEVVIEGPDPATVLSAEDLIAAFPTPAEDLETPELVTGEPLPLETVDGPRERYDVIDDLAKFGYVTGVGPDPWTLDLDARYEAEDAVWEVADEELVARYNELDAALTALPHTTTTLGELTRPELLWNVKWGLDDVGGDAAVADGLGDAELGALIDGFVEQNGGPIGDGVFGSLPPGVFDEGAAATYYDDEYSTEDELSIDEEFEGCPG